MTRTSMRNLVTLVAVLLPLNSVKADEPRYCTVFTSPNQQYELKQAPPQPSQLKRQRWSLIEKGTGQVLYPVEGEFDSRTVLVSDDGNSLVVIDDFSERRPSPDLDVLTFYRKGVIVKNYLLGNLLSDVSNIQSSVSHFQWFFEPWKASIVDSRLKLRTYELVDYEFNTDTGALLKTETDPLLSDGSVYVYGQVKALGGGRFEIEVCQQVYGLVPTTGKIDFVAQQNEFRAGYSRAVVIKNGTLVTSPVVILNSCNYRRKKP